MKLFSLTKTLNYAFVSNVCHRSVRVVSCETNQAKKPARAIVVFEAIT